jgi:glyoxylase-like metal-dependent hydrolase (beta-lactamase superfamily II)
VPYLLAALGELGIAREAVDYVLLTHVHLDHAGGAGQLMRALPNARAVIHPRGAPHMIDPAKLIAASQAVYGEARFRELYGEIAPIPAERVITTEDGQRLSLAGRELELIHTPGHALHHYAIFDRTHGNLFTGDTFGISYREFDTENGAFVIPTTTPSQFDPGQLVDSIDRLLAYEPRALYLTHYSRVTDAPRLAEQLKMQIRRLVTIARDHHSDTNRHEAICAGIRELWIDLLRRHGCTLPETEIDALLGLDADLNAQGLIVWLDRERKG